MTIKYGISGDKGFDNRMRFIDPDGMSEVEGVNYSDGYSTQNTKTTTGSIELWQLSADAQKKGEYDKRHKGCTAGIH